MLSKLGNLGQKLLFDYFVSLTSMRALEYCRKNNDMKILNQKLKIL